MVWDGVSLQVLSSDPFCGLVQTPPSRGHWLLKAHSYAFSREVTSAEWKPVQLGGYSTSTEVTDNDRLRAAWTPCFKLEKLCCAIQIPELPVGSG